MDGGSDASVAQRHCHQPLTQGYGTVDAQPLQQDGSTARRTDATPGGCLGSIGSATVSASDAFEVSCHALLELLVTGAAVSCFFRGNLSSAVVLLICFIASLFEMTRCAAAAAASIPAAFAAYTSLHEGTANPTAFLPEILISSALAITAFTGISAHHSQRPQSQILAALLLGVCFATNPGICTVPFCAAFALHLHCLSRGEVSTRFSAAAGLYSAGLLFCYFCYRSEVGSADGSIMDVCSPADPATPAAAAAAGIGSTAGQQGWLGYPLPPCGLGLTPAVLHLGSVFAIAARFAARTTPAADPRPALLAGAMVGAALAAALAYPSPLGVLALLAACNTLNGNGRSPQLLLYAAGVCFAHTAWVTFRHSQSIRWIQVEAAAPAAPATPPQPPPHATPEADLAGMWGCIAAALLLAAAALATRHRRGGAAAPHRREGEGTPLLPRQQQTGAAPPRGEMLFVGCANPDPRAVPALKGCIAAALGAIWCAGEPNLLHTAVFLAAANALFHPAPGVARWKTLLLLTQAAVVTSYALFAAPSAIYSSWTPQPGQTSYLLLSLITSPSRAGMAMLFAINGVGAWLLHTRLAFSSPPIRGGVEKAKEEERTEEGGDEEEEEVRWGTPLMLFSITVLLGVAFNPATSHGLLPALGIVLFSLGAWAACGMDTSESRRFLSLAACTCLVVAVLFQTARISDTTLDTPPLSWLLRGPIGALRSTLGMPQTANSISPEALWVTTSLLFCAQAKRGTLESIRAPPWGVIAISGVIVPIALLGVSVTGPLSGTVSGAIYYMLGCITSLPRCIGAYQWVSGRGAKLWRFTWLGVAVPSLVLLHLLVFPARSGFLSMPFSETWNVFVADDSDRTTEYIASIVAREIRLSELYPHFIILTLALLDRWAWVHAVARFRNPDLGGTSDADISSISSGSDSATWLSSPSDLDYHLFASSVLYELFLLTLACTTLVVPTSLAVVALGMLILSCFLGRSSFMRSTRCSTLLFTYCVFMGFASYAISGADPTLGQVALQYGTAFIASMLTAVNVVVKEMFFRQAEVDQALVDEGFKEGYSNTLVSRKAEISRALEGFEGKAAMRRLLECVPLSSPTLYASGKSSFANTAVGEVPNLSFTLPACYGGNRSARSGLDPTAFPAVAASSGVRVTTPRIEMSDSEDESTVLLPHATLELPSAQTQQHHPGDTTPGRFGASASTPKRFSDITAWLRESFDTTRARTPRFGSDHPANTAPASSCGASPSNTQHPHRQPLHPQHNRGPEFWYYPSVLLCVSLVPYALMAGVFIDGASHSWQYTSAGSPLTTRASSPPQPHAEAMQQALSYGGTQQSMPPNPPLSPPPPPGNRLSGISALGQLPPPPPPPYATIRSGRHAGRKIRRAFEANSTNLPGASESDGSTPPGRPHQPASTGDAPPLISGGSTSFSAAAQPLAVSQVLRIAYAVYAFAAMPDIVWLGSSAWQVSYYLYSALLLYWWVSGVGILPTWAVEEVSPNRFPALLLAGLLWKWGRVMDSPYWGHVLLEIHKQRLRAQREGARIAAEKKDLSEAGYAKAAAQREARRDALSELQLKKADLNKAWRKLLRGETPKVASTPPPSLFNTWRASEISPGLPPEETVSPIHSAASLPAAEPPQRAEEFLSFILSYTYSDASAASVQSWVATSGWFHTLSRVAFRVVSSLGAETVYIVTAFHFLVNPCIATLLPIATVFLYAMCSSPFPERGYWRLMLRYYQILVVAKAVLLSFTLRRKVPLPGPPMLLTFGWRNVMQPGDFSLAQFAGWEILLLTLLMFHRHCLVHVWGLWRTFDIRNGRYLPVTHCTHVGCAKRRMQASGPGGVPLASTMGGGLGLSEPCDRLSENIHVGGVAGGARFAAQPPAAGGSSSSSPTYAAGIPELSAGMRGGPHRLAMWGGVRVSGGRALGGAAVQSATQARACVIPAWLSRQGRNLWRGLVNVSAKTGADLYAPAFVTDMASWIVTLAGFPALIGSNDSIAESIKNNLLPGVLVLILFVQFLFMIADRTVYLLRSLQAKAAFHAVLTCLYLSFYLGWCYVHMERYGSVVGQTYLARWKAAQTMRPNLVLEIYSGLKLLYLAISALQIRLGYPDLIQPHFFSGRYSAPWYYLYTVYRGVPFLFEFRSVLDWTFTKTSLKLSYWLRLEDITHELHVCLCDKEDTRLLYEETGGGGKAFPLHRKCMSGAAFLAGLSVLLFFPLLWYSSYGPALTEDYVADARFQVTLDAGDQNFGPLYEGLREMPDIAGTLQELRREGKGLSLSLDWNLVLEKTRQSLVGFGLAYGSTRTAQMVSFQEASQTLWDVPAAAKATLADRLANRTLPVVLMASVTLHRPFAPPSWEAVTGRQSHTLSDPERDGMLAVLNGTQRTVRLSLMYSPVALNRASELKFFDGELGVSNRISCDLGLVHDSPYAAYWTVSCASLLQRGNPPGVSGITGLGDFPFSQDELACIHATPSEEPLLCSRVAYDSDKAQQHFSGSLGAYLLAVNDRVTNGNASMIPSIGVVAIYTTFVLAVGRVLRSSLTGDASKLHLLEVDTPGELNTLVSYVQMARMEGDLELEHGLYRELVTLFRSADHMRQWTSGTGLPLSATAGGGRL